MSFCILDNYLSLLVVISLNIMLIVSVQPELKLVNVLFRHGDRTPTTTHEMFPNDPYLNYSFLPTGRGELINQGKKRMYELGQVLRNRYKDFLGDLYQPKLVMAHSSDSDRTKMSLQLVLAGLFPPKDTQRWNTDLNWQPIPITYIPRVTDNFFTFHECPQYLDEYDCILNLSEMKKITSQFKNIMSKLTELTGKNIETFLDLFYLYHTFLSESSLNLTLPQWTHDYFPDGPLFDGYVQSYYIANFTPLIRRLSSGSIIHAILNNIIAAKNSNKPHAKIYLYSGHDVNIASLLLAFNLYEPHVPKYASAIIMELQEVNQKYYVKLLYYKGIPPTIKELQIPGCDGLCPFEKFFDLVKDFIPSDDETICDKRQTPDYAHIKYPVDLQRIVYNLIKTSAIERQNYRQ